MPLHIPYTAAPAQIVPDIDDEADEIVPTEGISLEELES
jgi:hypothetical protein